MKRLFALFIALGCTLMVNAQDYPDDCLENLEIPATFTPNGDGINQAWAIEFPCPPEEFEIIIYDRWGAEIYTSNDNQFQFIGEDKDGKQVSAGTYIYRMTYTFNGGEFKNTGNFTVIK